MRLFQNSALYPSYRPRLDRLTRELVGFVAHRKAFLDDRFGACHFLEPVLNGDASAFFTNGDDESLQQLWASEQGMPGTPALSEILISQIEHHRTEVFYNLDPLRYGSDFVRRLPGCVKHSIAWRAAPSPGADFGAYDRVVCNFPSILKSYSDRGWRTAHFMPAHDPEMDAYATNTDRPVDVLFIGGYTRHHRRRAEVLETVATLRQRHRIVFHLDSSRLTRLAESTLGRMLPLGRHRRPEAICALSAPPVFGRDLYAAISKAKIVLNGAVDMAGDDRGNMRCFEAMGCGALLVSDVGRYPAGIDAGHSMMTYSDATAAASVVSDALSKPDQTRAIAAIGHESIRQRYSKARQWQDFQRLYG